MSKLAALESELAAAGVTIRSLTSERDTLSELVRSTGTRCADVEAREGQERARANEAEGGRREAEGKVRMCVCPCVCARA